MSISRALDAAYNAAAAAYNADDRQQGHACMDIYRAILEASLPKAKQWSETAHKAIERIQAGQHVGTLNDARRLLQACTSPRDTRNSPHAYRE